MLEKLLVYAMLLNIELVASQKYNEYLDTLFLENETNDLLLELEYCSSNPMKSLQLIQAFSQNNDSVFNYNTFGEILLKELNWIFSKSMLDIQTFGEKAYELWHQLPSCISDKVPFLTLSYADDCLSWGDEKQTRELYQKALEYYLDN